MIYNITPFILAGGKSRRFGEDKAMYKYRGKPLIIYVAEQLSGFTEQPVIIAKDKADYLNLGYTVIEDALPYQTPLAGIYTGLVYSQTVWNLFIACDMPNIDVESIHVLLNAIPEKPCTHEIIVPRTAQGLEPTAALYRKSLSNKIMQVHKEIYSLKNFIRSCDCKIIDFESSKPFVNVNTKEQLAGII